MRGNNPLLRSTTKNNKSLNTMNMNMNSVKETIKKTNTSPAAKSAAELSSPATPPLKNAPVNSTIDGNKAIAPKPLAPVSMPAPTAAKVSTIPAQVKDVSTPALRSFAPASTPAPAAAKVSTIPVKVKDASTPAPQPFAPVSTAAPTAAKVSTIAAKVKDASTPAPRPFALLAATPLAPAPKAAAVEDKRAPGQKSAVSPPRATTIEAKIDVGFGNAIYLRGQGPGLSWERGVPCECVNGNIWRWSAPRAEKLTFKLLLNDSVWSKGADLEIGPGEKVEVVPSF
jgi:hypothetical protein